MSRKAIEDAAAKFSEDNTDDAKEIVFRISENISRNSLETLYDPEIKMDSKMREGVDEEVV